MEETIYIPVNEVCKRVGISKATLYRYVKQGMMSRYVGSVQVFNEDEVRRWKAQKEINEKRGRKLNV